MRSTVIFFLLFVSIIADAQLTFVKKWDKRYGGSRADAFQYLIQTPDKGYILSGTSNSSITGDKTQDDWDITHSTSDSWILKIDSVGNKQWDKRFGGTYWENALMIKRTFEGGYIFGGLSSSGISGDKSQSCWGAEDYWIVKIDSIGNKEWDKRFGGILEEDFTSIIQTKDSGYVLAGWSKSPISGDKTQNNWDATNNHYDNWVVKIDALGNKQWDRRFGGIDNELMYPGCLLQTKDGNYLLGSPSASGISGDKTQASKGWLDYWIIKIDSVGNKIWDKSFGGTDANILTSIITIKDAGFLLGGYSYSDTGADKTQHNWGGKDYWIIKIDSAGNKLWDKDYGGIGDEELYNLYATNDGGYLIAGTSESNTSGDKSEDNLSLLQAWIIKTDSVGNKQWDKTIFIDSFAYNIYAMQANDGCYIVGNSTKAQIAGYKSQTSWGDYDYWILKFCMDTVTGINELTDQPQILVYPNPFATDISISLQNENLHQATFTITNLVGQTIYRREETNLANNYTKMLDLSYLPNGMYLLEVTIDGQRTTKQIIKQ